MSIKKAKAMHIIEDAIKVERLALIALQLTNVTQRSDAWLEKSMIQRDAG